MQNPFIKKVRNIILDHLDDEKFGVSQLASEIGWSRSHTFKKVKSVKGISVNQFIKEIRLQEAAKLIIESNFNLHTGRDLHPPCSKKIQDADRVVWPRYILLSIRRLHKDIFRIPDPGRVFICRRPFQVYSACYRIFWGPGQLIFIALHV